MELIDTKMPESNCTNCGKKLDGALGPGTPQPGDLTVCADCSEVLAFNDDLTLRALDDTDFELMPPETLVQIQNAVKVTRLVQEVAKCRKMNSRSN